MLRFDTAKYLSFIFKSTFSERLSNSLLGSDVLFLECINIVSILFYNFTEFIILLYTFLVISFARYKEYIYLIGFSKFSEVLPAFGNLWSIYLRVKILSPFPYISQYFASNSEKKENLRKKKKEYFLLNQKKKKKKKKKKNKAY